ncbi:MAG: hypothetical protein AAGK97_15030 [Bacteroidota bacterium]
MTLREFFDVLSNNPGILIFFYLVVPLTAVLAWVLGQGEGHKNPWKYLYSVLVFMTTIPGIFAITLSVYVWLFERKSIMDTNLYTQILPVVSMIATLYLIRRNVSFDKIPGFHRLGGLIIILFAMLVFMWVLDRTHIFAITFIPFQYVLIGFVFLLVAICYGWTRFYGNQKESAKETSPQK